MLKYDSFCLWKESLNCDGYKFYQYQQNEQLPLTSSNWTQGDHDIMPLIIILISKYNTDINKQLKKACTDSLPLKKTMHLLLKKNEWQHKHEQFNSSVSDCSRWMV
jgi:hypothetical protein